MGCKQTGGTVDPKRELEKPLTREQERKEWKNLLKGLGTALVSQTNEVLVKTLSEHDNYNKRSNDLFMKIMAQTRHGLDSLKLSSDYDTIIPKQVIVTRPS